MIKQFFVLFAVFFLALVSGCVNSGYNDNTGSSQVINVSRDYARNISLYSLNFSVINDSGDIPNNVSKGVSPSNYSEIIHPPVVSRSDGTYVVTLYAWTKRGGLLSRWNLTVKDDKVVYRYGESIGFRVGDYDASDLSPYYYVNISGVIRNESLLNTNSEREEAIVAKDYLNNVRYDFNNGSYESLSFVVIDNASVIPYTAGELPANDFVRDPADYSAIIHPPEVVVYDNVSHVFLYTWSRHGGILTAWNLTVKDGRVVYVYADCIDEFVGHYSKVVDFYEWIPYQGTISTSPQARNSTGI